MLTALAGVGSTLEDGSVAYRADGEATVVLVDDTPSYRALERGDTGADVLALEQLLDRLGRADGLTVDDEFTAATADAVQDWEDSLGRSDPDGVVEVGDLLVLAEPLEVTGAPATVGDEVPDGTPVLTLGTGESDAVVTVDVADLDGWVVGTTARVEVSDETVTGRVREVGRDAVEDRVEVRVEVGDVDALPGTPVEASVTVAQRGTAVSVPVSALVTGSGGGTVVRAVTGEGDAATEEELPVEVGLVVDGWAEVSGVDEGRQVRVPG